MEEEALFQEKCVESRLRVFEGTYQPPVPPGFDAITLPLNGRLRSDLDWREAQTRARQAVKNGYKLMWDLQLGLFGELEKPLDDQTQFLALTLALEHFSDSIWKEFGEETVGVSLFRGSADFSQSFPWDPRQREEFRVWLKERGGPELPDSLRFALFGYKTDSLVDSCIARWISLFCCEAAADYLSLLSRHLPESLPLYLYLDGAACWDDGLLEMQLFNPVRYEGFRFALRGCRLPFEGWGWGTPSPFGYSGTVCAELPLLPSASIGLCIPPPSYCHPHCYEGVEEAMETLRQRALSFKMIAEESLASMWEGLDYLLYVPAALSASGKRKLMGFCAAGGVAVAIGRPIGLPEEKTLAECLSEEPSFLVHKKS